MPHQLRYSKRAVKDIALLDPVIKERLGRDLLRFALDPLKYAKKLRDSKLGSYRFRSGDYLIIFDLDQEAIYVLRIGHRREIYR